MFAERKYDPIGLHSWSLLAAKSRSTRIRNYNPAEAAEAESVRDALEHT
jgi:hypothetical protein